MLLRSSIRRSSERALLTGDAAGPCHRSHPPVGPDGVGPKHVFMAQLRNRHLLLVDAIFLTLAAWLGFAIRFEGADWPAGMFDVASETDSKYTPPRLRW